MLSTPNLDRVNVNIHKGLSWSQATVPGLTLFFEDFCVGKDVHIVARNPAINCCGVVNLLYFYQSSCGFNSELLGKSLE